MIKTNQIFFMNEFGKLMDKADSYCPIGHKNETIDFQPVVFKNCMSEINEIRSSGNLLKLGRSINCPVIAIHGEDDPHPFLGIKDFLSNTISNFDFLLLKKCGHTPWYEKYANDDFYIILEGNL